ncbi:Cuticle Protein CPR RR-1 6 [Frankliniella occidentalis]|uniref:Larval cuticle protein 65Ag1-like n=1 Tax=Frankliniella occidentalis TaxID=133901 RepID=A0A6J1S6A7_FRAOC|nr:larval cuticle protein 65Ag1-like [Frankliniella occidentalis]KAE8744066.1 Cuticle Protein CPR RR-1 6 [Frankliniella occidentalis]
MNKFVITVFGLCAVASLSCGQQQPSTPEPIAIVKLNSDVNPDGSFTYEYETANGIKADARGALNNAGSENEALSVQGSYSFVGDDGVTYTVTYVADENGFQPQGAHLPTPPPIPEAILRSIEYNAAHPEENEVKARR